MMGGGLGTQGLKLVVNGDTSGAVGALRKLDGGLGNSGKMGGTFGSLMRKGALLAAGAFVALAAGVFMAVRTMVSWVGTSKAYISNLLTMRRYTGMTTAQVSLLSGQFRLTGVDATAGTNGIRFFVKNLYSAQTGTKAMVANFDALHINLKNGDGTWRKSADVLSDVRTRMSKLTDTTERTALAQRLFGRGGAALIPWLIKSGQEMDKLNAAVKTNGMFTDKDIESYKKFVGNQRLMSYMYDMLKVKAGLMAMTLVNKVFPALKKLYAEYAPKVKSALVGAFSWVDAHMPTIKAALSTIADVLKNVWKYAALIGTAFAAWKVSGGIVSVLGAVGVGGAALAAGSGAGLAAGGADAGGIAGAVTSGMLVAAAPFAAALAAAAASVILTKGGVNKNVSVTGSAKGPSAASVYQAGRMGNILPGKDTSALSMQVHLVAKSETLSGDLTKINRQIAAAQAGSPTTKAGAIITKLQAKKAQIETALAGVDKQIMAHKTKPPDLSALPPAFTKAGGKSGASLAAVIAKLHVPAPQIAGAYEAGAAAGAAMGSGVRAGFGSQSMNVTVRVQQAIDRAKAHGQS